MPCRESLQRPPNISSFNNFQDIFCRLKYLLIGYTCGLSITAFPNMFLPLQKVVAKEERNPFTPVVAQTGHIKAEEIPLFLDR